MDIIDGAECQSFDKPRRDQSAINMPDPNTPMAENKNRAAITVLALDENEVPDLGPKTTAAIERAENKHPNL